MDKLKNNGILSEPDTEGMIKTSVRVLDMLIDENERLAMENEALKASQPVTGWTDLDMKCMWVDGACSYGQPRTRITEHLEFLRKEKQAALSSSTEAVKPDAKSEIKYRNGELVGKNSPVEPLIGNKSKISEQEPGKEGEGEEIDKAAQIHAHPFGLDGMMRKCFITGFHMGAKWRESKQPKQPEGESWPDKWLKKTAELRDRAHRDGNAKEELLECLEEIVNQWDGPEGLWVRSLDKAKKLIKKYATI